MCSTSHVNLSVCLVSSRRIGLRKQLPQSRSSFSSSPWVKSGKIWSFDHLKLLVSGTCKVDATARLKMRLPEIKYVFVRAFQPCRACSWPPAKAKHVYAWVVESYTSGLLDIWLLVYWIKREKCVWPSLDFKMLKDHDDKLHFEHPTKGTWSCMAFYEQLYVNAGFQHVFHRTTAAKMLLTKEALKDTWIAITGTFQACHAQPVSNGSSCN